MTYHRHLYTPEVVKEIVLTSPTSIRIEYNSGASITANQIKWSVSRNRAKVEDDGTLTPVTSGTAHFSQISSANSIVGVEVSVDNPLLFNGVTYTSIDTLGSDLITALP